MTLPAITADSPLRGLADELQRQLKTRRDIMADTRLVSLTGDGDNENPEPLGLAVDLPEKGELVACGVTRHAHGQIANHLSIPWKLYDRLHTTHPDLLKGLVNPLLAREPEPRLIRCLDGDVRAFLSNRYRRRDNWDLLEQAVLPALAEHPGVFEIKKCDLTETHMYVKVFMPGLERQVTPKKGDVIRGGAIIKNSEVGSSQLLIAPYTDVLICTNGMVHTEYGQGRRHVGRRIDVDAEEAWDMYSDETLALDDAAFFAKCRDTLRNVLNEAVFDRIVADMRELAGLKMPDVPKAVELLDERHGFTEGEQSSILQAIIEGGDLTAWGVVNGITQTARDHADPDRATDLEALAGRLVSDQAWAVALAA